MREQFTGVVICVFIGIATVCVFNRGTRAQQERTSTNDASDATSADQSSVERGQYLVHHVAMCIYCHTQHSQEGVPDEQRLLQGAPMPVASPFPRQQWAFQAPKIAGLPGGWTEANMVKFLQTGESPTGRQPQPPMPPFRFNEEDANAVAVYLRSLD